MKSVILFVSDVEKEIICNDFSFYSLLVGVVVVLGFFGYLGM